MPNPGKYKSVGVSIDAYDKLVAIADHEDRAIGRQLARMIEETYENIQDQCQYQGIIHDPSSFRESVGLASVIDD
jgi:hypothetical protein